MEFFNQNSFLEALKLELILKFKDCNKFKDKTFVLGRPTSSKVEKKNDLDEIISATDRVKGFCGIFRQMGSKRLQLFI